MLIYVHAMPVLKELVGDIQPPEFTETSIELSRAVTNIADLQENIKAAWQNYTARFESVDNALSKVFEELDAGLARYTQSIKEFIEGLDQHTSSIVSDLAGASSELNSAIEELSDIRWRSGRVRSHGVPPTSHSSASPWEDESAVAVVW